METLGPFPLFRAPPSSAELLNREMRNKRPRSMLPRRHDFKRAPRTKGEAPAPQTDGVKRTWHAAKSAAASPSDQRCDDPAPRPGPKPKHVRPARIWCPLLPRGQRDELATPLLPCALLPLARARNGGSTDALLMTQIRRRRRQQQLLTHRT